MLDHVAVVVKAKPYVWARIESLVLMATKPTSLPAPYQRILPRKEKLEFAAMIQVDGGKVEFHELPV